MRGYSVQLSLLVPVLYKDVLIFHADSCGSVDVGKGEPHGADWHCAASSGWVPLAGWGLRQRSSAYMWPSV